MSRIIRLMRSLFGGKTAAETVQAAEIAADVLPYKLVRVSSAQQIMALRQSNAAQQVILIGDSHSVEALSVTLSTATQTSGEILTAAQEFEVHRWASPEARAEALADGVSMGEWPTHVLSSVPILHPSESENLLRRGTFAAVLPCREAWAAPAYLPVGDLDQCPPPHVHVALARQWHRQFGAEIVAITSSTTEFLVPASPTGREACEQLAWEHFLYAPECLEDWSVREYAYSLQHCSRWFFLWD